MSLDSWLARLKATKNPCCAMAKKKERTITDAVRDLMAHLPETEEFISHGAPTFRVRGKIFAVYTINHHGDGRVALNLKSPKGAQALYTKVEPDVYFVPPYTGPKGWLGVQLDKGLSWKAISEHAQDAYREVAPMALIDDIDPRFRVRSPTRKFRPEEIDPFKSKRAKAVLKKLESICSALPETSPSAQFGNPTWVAGKKNVRQYELSHRAFSPIVLGGAQRAKEAEQGQALLGFALHRPQRLDRPGRRGAARLERDPAADPRKLSSLCTKAYAQVIGRKLTWMVKTTLNTTRQEHISPENPYRPPAGGAESIADANRGRRCAGNSLLACAGIVYAGLAGVFVIVNRVPINATQPVLLIVMAASAWMLAWSARTNWIWLAIVSSWTVISVCLALLLLVISLRIPLDWAGVVLGVAFVVMNLSIPISFLRNTPRV